MTDSSPARIIADARRYSAYVDRALGARPELAAHLAAHLHRALTRADMRAFLAAAPARSVDDLARGLRRLRQWVFCHLAARDLAGLAPLREVTAAMSVLAEVAVGHALAFLHPMAAAEWGTPIGRETGAPQEMIVVGMGKLGGGELNVSSDIDLIFAYPEEGETDAARPLSNHEFFARLARRLIAALNDLTADGFVFRVDMRLRPDGDSGAIVSSFASLEHYYQIHGREWERYAWIKGRVIHGARGDELVRLLQPFVYRKYLDYGSIASMRQMHGQIAQEVRRRDRQDNIKTGPGGIREIEFTAQVFQLIRGGREKALQARPTLKVLSLLAARGLLPAETAVELRDAYVFLRRLEHRLQYADDAQTHRLPADSGARARVAASMGFVGEADFLAALEAHRARVSAHFAQLFAGAREERDSPLAAAWRPETDEEAALETLGEAGFAQPARVLERLRGFQQSQRYLKLGARLKQRLDHVVPALLDAARACGNRDETLWRAMDLVEAVCQRESYLALLDEYPTTVSRVAGLVSASPWAATFMARHPLVLDTLLIDEGADIEPDWARIRAFLAEELANAGDDAEMLMDRLRQFRSMRVFEMLCLDLAGALPVERLGDHLSALADLLLDEVVRLCWRQMKGDGAPRFAVVAYGKLGGKELGYASDLDIIFLYDDAAPEASERYSRLAQRVVTWLTSYTAAGVLYETDLRLRPDGASGLLVSRVEAFEDYQRRHAWAWEHQALTRARFAAGDADIGARFEQIRREVLAQPRDPGALARDVLAMRERMLRAHPNPSGLFDLKHDRGGMVDIEFIVQYLVLAHASRHPPLTANAGNIALLRTAAALGLVDAAQAAAAQVAYRQYRRWQHACRLQEARYARVAPEQAAPHIQQVAALWAAVFGSAAQ